MLAEVYGEVMRAAGAADRASEVLAAQPEITVPETPRALPSPLQGGLAFHDVTFRYDPNLETGENLPALEHFSLEVQPGEFVALVGSGAAPV